MASPDKTLVEIVTELVKAEVAKTLEDLKVDTIKEARKVAKERGQKFWTLVPGAEERAIRGIVDMVTKALKDLLLGQINTDVPPYNSPSTHWVRLTDKGCNPGWASAIIKALGEFSVVVDSRSNYGSPDFSCRFSGTAGEAKAIRTVPEFACKLVPRAETAALTAKQAHDQSTRHLDAARYRLSLLEAAAKNAPKRPRQD